MRVGLYQRVDFGDFVESFERMGRQEQFSLKGLRKLFAYLEGLADERNEALQLDIVSLCCDFVEYNDIHTAWNDLAGAGLPEPEDKECKFKLLRGHLLCRTTVLSCTPDCILFAVY